MAKFAKTSCSQCGREFGPGDSGFSHCDQHDERALRLALALLSNEVLGSLPLMEPLARREFGNSNYNILIKRAEQARALLTHTVITTADQ